MTRRLTKRQRERLAQRDASLTDDQRVALDHARHLIEHGVPVFAASPAMKPKAGGGQEWDPAGGHDGTGYWLPKGWQTTTPDPATLDKWWPGDALCMVTGHVVDGVDVDPHKGGADSLASLNGTMPVVYGVASTPSGGQHHLIAALGVHSRDAVLPGLDIKAGVSDEERGGHGFIFIAPTAKVSKTTGEVGAYRWTEAPDLDRLDLLGPGMDKTGAALAAKVQAAHAASGKAFRTYTGPAYTGPAYGRLTPAQQAQAAGVQAERVESLRGRLAAALGWEDGYVDHKGRGWEKLTRDAAAELAAMAFCPWLPMDHDDAMAVWVDVLPAEMGGASSDPNDADAPPLSQKLCDSRFAYAATLPVKPPPWETTPQPTAADVFEALVPDAETEQRPEGICQFRDGCDQPQQNKTTETGVKFWYPMCPKHAVCGAWGGRTEDGQPCPKLSDRDFRYRCSREHGLASLTDAEKVEIEEKRARAHEKEVRAAADKILLRREALRLADADERGPRLEPVTPTRLDDLLDEPDEATPWLVDGLWPKDGRVVLAAQAKAGKTTLTTTLVQCLADGGKFLDQFATSAVGRTVLIDNEMPRHKVREWLRRQNIENAGAVEVVSLRGSLSSFDIFDAEGRTAWAEAIGPADVLIFDCLRPVLDAFGLDENHDAGRFLTLLSELCGEAGIGSLMVLHHMGHSGERSRGDSSILGWPDANWKLVKSGDADNAPRYFSAYGRDVDQPEGLLAYDAHLSRLTLAGGDRRAAADARTELRRAARMDEYHDNIPALWGTPDDTDGDAWDGVAPLGKKKMARIYKRRFGSSGNDGEFMKVIDALTSDGVLVESGRGWSPAAVVPVPPGA